MLFICRTCTVLREHQAGVMTVDGILEKITGACVRPGCRGGKVASGGIKNLVVIWFGDLIVLLTLVY